MYHWYVIDALSPELCDTKERDVCNPQNQYFYWVQSEISLGAGNTSGEASEPRAFFLLEHFSNRSQNNIDRLKSATYYS